MVTRRPWLGGRGSGLAAGLALVGVLLVRCGPGAGDRVDPFDGVFADLLQVDGIGVDDEDPGEGTDDTAGADLGRDEGAVAEVVEPLDAPQDPGGDDCPRENRPVCVDGDVWYADACGQPWARVQRCAHGCVSGSCRPCQPACAGRACGPDGCGGSCGPCGSGQACTAEGACCDRQCQGRECGPDGCGGTCGGCAGFDACGPDGRCGPCQPSCQGRECGSDGCGGTCGGCGPGANCDLDQCVSGVLPGGCVPRAAPPDEGWGCRPCVLAARPACAGAWEPACAARCQQCGTTCLDPFDLDRDGWADPDDCRPLDPSGYPGAAETCNGRDDDCDGLVDEAACPGCEALEWGGHVYLLCTLQRTWPLAQAACRASGYRLAAVDGPEEQAALAGLLAAQSWIGATDAASEGTFAWENGSTSTYANWFPGEPNDLGPDEDCVKIQHDAPFDGRWNDVSCVTAAAYVCERGCGGGPDLQPDGDADGLGDGCDDFPTDPDDDLDGDGWGAPDDNCPQVHNPDQGDGDADGVGDVCDLPALR